MTIHDSTTRNVETRKTADLRPHEANERIYGEVSDIESLADSIARDDFYQPLLITHDNRIIAGHRRHKAAVHLGLAKVPVVVFEDDDELAIEEALIESNDQRIKTNEQIGREYKRLKEIIHDRESRQGNNQYTDRNVASGKYLPEAGKPSEQAAAILGVSRPTADKASAIVDEIDALEADGNIGEAVELRKAMNKSVHGAAKKLARKKKNEALDAAAAVVPPVQDVEPIAAAPGMIVRIGGHLLLCGDNRAEWIRQIISEYEFALAFADPPYNAGVDEWDADFDWDQDYLSDVARIVAVTPGIGNIPGFMRSTAMPYKWSLATYINNGMTRSAVGFGNWMYTAIFAQEGVYRNAQDFCEISITGRQHSDTSAKRQKPTKYLAWLFDLFSEEGDVIYDPFGGSGSSVLVAHNMNRRCVCVERDVETFRTLVTTVRAAINSEAEVYYANAI